jgi:hypothetical protein
LGKVTETSKGLQIEGELELQVEKAREAYALMKRGILGGLSIGYDFDREGVRHRRNCPHRRATFRDCSPELLDDPNTRELADEAGKSMVARWRLSLAENGHSMAEARLLEAKEKFADNQKIADEKFAAEIAAVIEHFERTGEVVAGYVITE